MARVSHWTGKIVCMSKGSRQLEDEMIKKIKIKKWLKAKS